MWASPIFTKLVVSGIPLEFLQSYFKFSIINNNNMAGARNFKTGVNLVSRL